MQAIELSMYEVEGWTKKEVKWILMRKDGGKEEQEDDYAIVWD